MYKALIFTVLLVSAVAPVRSLDPPLNDDVLGLIVFKADLRDPEQKLASWNEDDYTPCSWNGVKCHPRTNRVTELNLDGFSLSGRIGRGLLQLQFLHKLSLSNNNLTGIINPNMLLSLVNLKVVDLSSNGLSGSLPDEFFRQCGSLRVLSLAKNKLTGKIPVSISSCSSLAALNLSSNGFSGSMPLGIWSLNTLRSLDLSRNELEGEFPEKIDRLNNLRALDLSRNRLSGPIPSEIGSCMLLKTIDLSENSLSGSLPNTFQQLSLCYSLNLGKNALEGEVPKWIGEMRSLETLDLSMNKFSGQVPDSIGNLLALKVLNFSGNGLIGSLPVSTANCINLLALDLSGNSLTGKLPMWLFQDGSRDVSALKNDNSTGGIKKIQVLDLSHNAFSGEIGAGLGDLRDLEGLHLSRNSLTGPIPSTIGELKHLSVLDVSHNQLNGMIPRETGGAVSLEELRLENNLLEGNIPSSIKNCSSLRSLILSHNKLLGSIPPELAKLTRLEEVDLSFNELAGTLPKQLANLGYLHTFNISHNHLFGELPAGGIFNGLSPSSVSGNPGICGAVVNKSCPAISPKPIVLNPNATFDPYNGEIVPPGAGHKRILLSISSLIAISAAAAIVVGVIAITVLNLRVRASTVSRSAVPLTFSGGDDFSRSPTTDSNSGKLVMFSGEPDFSTGTHALLNKDCELGRGGFGAVYRTVIRDGYPVAIKKLTVSSLVKSQDEFEREVKKLGKLRHSNLVKLEGYYWTTSLQLLIYEFLSGGSLYKQLHEAPGGNSSLSWNDRFNIILGTAKCLAYLHQSNIIHYNIKSSNVLLDSSGEPKVGDYGLARLLPMLDRYVLSSKIQSALGYMAPEFACRTVKITEKCDVYGFGVLVLEVVTGKKPVEYMEDDVVVLCDMVREALEDGRADECIDPRLQGKFPVEEAVAVIKLGLICTSQVPSSRPHMGEAVNILRMIRCPSGRFFSNNLLSGPSIMAASCFAIPLSSSSRSSHNAIPKYKTLISSSSYSYLESLKLQFSSSNSFHHSSLSRPFVAQPLQIKVSSSELSVLDEEKEEEVVKGEAEPNKDSVVSKAEPVKKPRPCELYVCNIPRSYDIAQLLDMFQPFGTVISVEVSRNPQTGESRGSGYVTMGSINSAKIAIASLDGTEVGGREMRVRYSVDMNPGTRRNPEVLNSTPKKILMYESQHKVYVGNLPWFTQPDGLRNHFSKFGTIVSTRVLHDRKTGRNRVFAFLSFTSGEERDAALSFNGTQYEGRRIIVREGIEKSES